jgi:uncharacterized metal-binding protein YceD (DUF177 family)
VNWRTKYDIAFKGLAEGGHEFDFQIDGKFFGHFENSLVDNGEADLKVNLEKRGAFLKLHITLKGWVELMCDRCLDNYRQEIKHKTELFVKFGEQEFEDGENVIWVLPEEHQINLAQIFYEYTRECNKEMLKKLKNYMNAPGEEEEQIDPRWEALKKLGNNN